MKLPERVRDMTEFVAFLFVLAAIVARGFTWPIVVGLVAVLVLHYAKNAIPDRRQPKVDAALVLAMQAELNALRGNVQNLNMVVGLKGTKTQPAPQ